MFLIHAHFFVESSLQVSQLFTEMDSNFVVLSKGAGWRDEISTEKEKKGSSDCQRGSSDVFSFATGMLKHELCD